MPHNRNVFVMTDDGPWIEKHKEHFKNEWNIYSIHGTNYHSKRSIVNGVNFLASIEAARQCSGFVGHSRSAVYNMVLDYMCTWHGPEGKRVYGKCPIGFDFGIVGPDNPVNEQLVKDALTPI